MPPKQASGKKRARPKPRPAALIKKEIFPEVKPEVKDLFKSDLSCGACLLSIESNESVCLVDSCAHAFHLECIERWAQTENSCPQCKRRFSWRASYKNTGKRSSLSKVAFRDQEGEEDEEFEDIQVCEVCKDIGDEATLLLCDGMHGTCNAAFHTTCVGLSVVPRGSWFCDDCTSRGFDIDARGRRGVRGPAVGSVKDSAKKRVDPSPPTPARHGGSASSSSSSSRGAAASSRLEARPQPPPKNQASAAPDQQALAVWPAQAGGRAAPRSVARPPGHGLGALAQFSAAVELPSYRPSARADGEAPTGIFARFAQRRRERRGTDKDEGSSFIRLNPSYEADFFADKVGN